MLADWGATISKLTDADHALISGMRRCATLQGVSMGVDLSGGPPTPATADDVPPANELPSSGPSNRRDRIVPQPMPSWSQTMWWFIARKVRRR